MKIKNAKRENKLNGMDQRQVIYEETYSNSGVVGVLQAETLYCCC